MKAIRLVLLAFLFVTTSGCYRQVVETGAAPGAVVVSKTAPTWVFGLVAAKEVDVRTMCTGGVAIIETQQTFINGLLMALTLGIYTPQTVRVTCAASAAVDQPVLIKLAKSATRDDVARAMETAIHVSMVQGDAVTLRF